jgi:hypothetical protein
MTTTHEARLERVRFFPRQLIGADDLNQEQHYHRQKLRNHNRFLHGWGVVCGLDVRAAGDLGRPWQVRICPGYALTPQGDEIHVGTEALFDLATCLTESADPCAYSRPCPPVIRTVTSPTTIYIAVRSLEFVARPVRVAPIGCGCDDADCEHSRIRDGYDFGCLDQLPSTHEEPLPDCEEICEYNGVVPCPPCPSEEWVVLANVQLPDRGEEISNDHIDVVTDRRILHSTTIVQQLARCICRTL